MKQDTWSKIGRWVETTAETAELISAFFELADVLLTAGWNLFHRESERIEPVDESVTIRVPRRKWESPDDEWQAWWENKRARDRAKEDEEFRAFILRRETSDLDRRYKQRMSDPRA